MGEVLKQQGRDSLADARVFAYKAIAETVAREPLSLPDILTRSRKLAEKLAVEGGKKSTQPWASLFRMLEREIVRLDLALDEEGNPVWMPTWEAAPLVHRLEDDCDWTVQIDAEFVYCLVQQMSNITRQDAKNLSRALYRSPDYEPQVLKAVEYLRKRGRVGVTEIDGQMCLSVIQPAVGEELEAAAVLEPVSES